MTQGREFSNPPHVKSALKKRCNGFVPKNRLFFTGIVEGYTNPQPSILPATGSIEFTHSRLFGLNWQHTFGAETFNEARFGYDREFFNEGSVTDFGPNLSQQLGLANVPNNPALFGLPVVSLAGGYQGIGNGNNGYWTLTLRSKKISTSPSASRWPIVSKSSILDPHGTAPTASHRVSLIVT